MKKQAFNPYFPSFEYIPDGEPYVFGGRVYVYGSHDAFGGKDFCVNNYVCWSAAVDDLGDWRYEGIIYEKQQDPLCDDVNKRLLFAPDVQRGMDGRYYLYYAFDSLSIISVAVCDMPAGKYEFYGHVHYKDGTLLGRRKGDIFQFDPGVYREGEHVYLYSGFCPAHKPEKLGEVKAPVIKGPVVMELETDMLTIKKEASVIAPYAAEAKGTGFEGHEFFEASSMRKVKDKYYFIYSSVHGHELCYAVSDYPDKNFVYGGTIVSNADIYFKNRTAEQALNYYGNNHGSIVEIEGQWYVFYHRHTNRIQYSRQACAEKIYFQEDGSIPQVEITSCGLNQGPLLGTGRYEARIACNLMSRKGAVLYGLGDRPIEDCHPYFTQDGTDRETDPDQHIANMTNGAAAGFKYFDMKDASRITVEVRGNGCGHFQVLTDLDGEANARIELEPAKDWKKFSADINIKNGVTALYFKYCGEGAFDFLSFELE